MNKTWGIAMSVEETSSWAIFQTTQWDLVRGAVNIGDVQQREALANLVARYLPPLRAYLVNYHRLDEHRADDLLQGFLLSKVMEARLLQRADPGRGRLRAFLCRALDHYVVSEYRRERAKKRAPNSAVSVEQAFAIADPALTPPQAFEIAWARELLGQVLSRMKQECASSEREDIWGVFEARLLGPLLGIQEVPRYEQLVKTYGFASPAKASNVLTTARRMFVRLLRAAIAEYEPDETAIDAEIVELIKASSISSSSARPQLGR